MVRGNMTSRDRLESAFLGFPRDRTPILGGWLACPDYICRIAGVDAEAYGREPVKPTIRAYEKLGWTG